MELANENILSKIRDTSNLDLGLKKKKEISRMKT